MSLIARLKAWRERRYWQKRHLNFLRNMIRTDHQWLRADWRGGILLERYEKMLSTDWHKHDYEDIDDLRKRLGWCPHDQLRRKHGRR
jgi:hypothetical protein